jgi:hypothetical protein
MAKGSRLSRLIEWYRTADIEEAKYVHARGADILSERQIPQTIQGKLVLGKRKRRKKVVEVPTVAQEQSKAVSAGE